MHDNGRLDNIDTTAMNELKESFYKLFVNDIKDYLQNIAEILAGKLNNLDEKLSDSSMLETDVADTQEFLTGNIKKVRDFIKYDPCSEEFDFYNGNNPTLSDIALAVMYQSRKNSDAITKNMDNCQDELQAEMIKSNDNVVNKICAGQHTIQELVERNGYVVAEKINSVQVTLTEQKKVLDARFENAIKEIEISTAQAKQNQKIIIGVGVVIVILQIVNMFV